VDQFITDYSLSALFLLSFGASTLLPLGSEWLLALLIADGRSPGLVVAVATTGNFLGACTTYLIGLWGADFIIAKLFRIGAEKSDRAQQIFRKWGVWSLFFSWLPVIGDPLCLVAGIFKTNPIIFSLLVISGKALRYIFVAWVVSSALT
jgi:membrane protein YqaA with SNARE-associated domain